MKTSPTSRAALVTRLENRSFDLLIIGGGIVGAGIARDASMRGLKVALIEQGDFASGTSSKTSKLIHGGLRYLEHGQWRLVFESLRERSILRTIAPALVRPLSLMLASYRDDSRPQWQIRLGLTLYDLLAWGHNVRRHRMVSARRSLELEPGLARQGLQGAGLYADCQMDDARLCLANVLQAVSFGAVCCNYVRLRALLNANGQLCGGMVEDLFTGREIEVQATVVINATGPWSDAVRRMSNVAATPQIAPTKGIHLILPRLAEEALFVEARADRRMLFLLPWGEHTLVGTTESAVVGALETLSAEASEVGYLLEEVNRVLPGRHVEPDDVIASFAGARPLLAFSGASSGASREHRIDVDRTGLVSVMGGKYTTYRLIAQQVVDAVIRQHQWRADRCLTDQISLVETTHPITMNHWYDVIRREDPDLLTRLLTRYGAGAFHLMELLATEPSLRQPLCPHHEYLEAEVVYTLYYELASTVTDVLARRTRVAWSSCQGLDTLSRVMELLQVYGGVTRDDMSRQVEEYRQFLARSLAFRPQAVESRHWAGDRHES